MATRAASMQGNADRSQDEKLMDEYLKANGLYRRRIAKDGSCLFRAVAEQVLHCQGLHTKVRAECVKYLRQNRELYESFIEGDFEEYLQRLQDPQSWVGQVEITALAVLYKHDFIIYQNPGEPPVNITENGYPDKVQLCFLNGNHYDSVYPVSFAKNAAMCQSILYELLYERVCGVDRSVLTSNMRGPKARDEDCKGSEDSDLDEGEDFWSTEATGKTTSGNSRPPYRGRGRGQTRGGGRGSLPFEVQDSLNPGLFRNVEYDVWMRSKKAQQRRDYFMAAGMQYAAGDKCQVQLTSSSRYYSAYIQDVSPNDGPVTVFIEELGEKHTVPLWNLRTPSEDSWSTVAERGKRHSVANGNGHPNEWESRGGRKPARSVSIPYGSKATASSAPSSHVQKQHSWPPQAPGETQGKNANSRKSDQDIGALGVSPEEEKEFHVLELLQKDENNFPTLEASAQAAAGGGGEGGRRAEKKGPRKKTDTETKEPPQKPDQKAEKGKRTVKKGSVLQEQRISPIKEKLSPSPPATPPSANSPAPSAPKATKATPAALATAPTPISAQTAPAPSKTPVISAETAHSQSQTAPVLSTASVSGHTQTASAPCAAPPNPQNAPTQSQTAPKANISASTTQPSSLNPNPSQTAPVPPAERSPTVSKPAPPQAAPAPTTTIPVPCPVISQTTSVPLTTPEPTPLSAPTALPTSALSQTTPIPTPALSPTSSATTQCPDPTHVPSQTAPATIPAMVTTPAPSHSTPTMSVSDPEVPVLATPHPAELPGPSSTPPAPVSVSAHIPPNPAHASHSITPPAPVNVSAASTPQLSSSSFAPFHPVGPGNFPVLPHYAPYMATVPTSAPMLTPTAGITSAPAHPFPPPEPHPYEPAGSPVAGMGSPAVPEYLPHGLSPHPQHPQHSFPLTQLSQLYQDPLYPGFPQNDKDEPVEIPSFSHQRTGKDLPTDVSVIRFFFNLGVKAFTNQMLAPIVYLAPLNHAYQFKPKAPPPAPSASPYPPPWQADNPPSMLHMSSTHNHSLMGPPIGAGAGAGGHISHFDIRSVVPGTPPLNVGAYGGHPHSVPMQPMPPQPGVPWSVPACPNVYAGIYSAPPAGQYPGPPCPPQGGQAYPSTSIGHSLLPFPPPQHRGMDIAMAAVAPTFELGEGDGQRSSTPQVDKPARFAGGHPHTVGGDNKPATVPVAVEPQRGGGASPVVRRISVGTVPSEGAELTMLANGNQRLDYNAKSSFQGGASVGLTSYMQSGSTVNELDLEEVEYGDADLRSGRSFYGRSFKAGARRGQEDRGGGGAGAFRGRGSRGRRDYIGRGNQPYYPRGHNSRGRGRGYVQHSNAGEAGYQGGPFPPAAKT
ncbi:OTU domain-containing protein 4 [Salminus brasiliensis]|uniref:OTU domain-containing protein 4 n=1 Tax=Salminus brasiliensis TaxID=930266 RepID=UPI003B834F31